MLKHNYFFYFLMLLSTSFSNLHGQEKSLSSSQLKNDFKIFKGSIKEAHPGLYWYSDTTEVDQNFENIENLLNKEMSVQEFYTILQEFYADIRCGHSWMSMPYNWRKVLDNGKHYFPFKLIVSDGRFYIAEDYSPNKTLGKRNEILSINGKDISKIKNNLYQYIPSDGYNTTKKDKAIQNRFSRLFQTFIQLDSIFSITVRDEQKNFTKTVQVVCISKELFDEKNKRESKNTDLIEFSMVNDSTGLLHLKTFSTSWIKNQQKVNPEKFLKGIFKDLRDKQTGKLILDLRGNGGGDDSFGALLTSYLIDHNYRYFNKMVMATKKYSYLKYSNTKHLNLIKLLVKKSKTEKNSYLWTIHKPLKLQRPKKEVFKGKLIVLTDGDTFSTAADVGAILHTNKRAIFVGEEIAGGYFGNNSAKNMHIKLPHSNINYWIPLVRYYSAVDFPSFIGHGVKPDFYIPYSIEDYQKKIDSVLLKALDILR